MNNINQNKKNIYFYKNKYGIITYHRKNGGLCLLDEKSAHFLKKYLDKEYDEINLSKNEMFFLAQLKEQRILVDEDINSDLVKTPAVTIIQLIVSNDCNFNCSYCFENKRETQTPPLNDTYEIEVSDYIRPHLNQKIMSNEAVQYYLDSMINYLKSTDKSDMMIQFFGGEPMLNWELIKSVLKHYKSGDGYDINIHYSMVTNGSLITDERAKLLSRYDVSVCVSFDSPNSKERVFKNGKNAKEKILLGVKNLISNNVRVAINCTLTDANYNNINDDMVKFLSDLGVTEIGLLLELDPDFYIRHSNKNIVNKLWSLVESGNKYGVFITGYWQQIIQLMAQRDGVSSRGYKMCSAKGSQFSIEPNGEVYSCKGANGHFGNIKNGVSSLLESLEYKKHLNLAFTNPKKCKDCFIENFCSGLCLGSLERKFKTIDIVEENACGVYKGITKKYMDNITPNQIPYLTLE